MIQKEKEKTEKKTLHVGQRTKKKKVQKENREVQKIIIMQKEKEKKHQKKLFISVKDRREEVHK